jgi:hypothetical protein
MRCVCASVEAGALISHKGEMMIRWGIAVGLLLSCIGVAPKAMAQQWILCPTCTTEAGFENAALQKAQSRMRDGKYLYSVGNPLTEQMMHVEVTIAPFDVVPLSWEDASYLNESDDGVGQQSIFVTGVEMQASSSGGSTVSIPATPAEQQTFSSAVRLSSKSLLMNHSTSVAGHESFAAARPENLGPMLHSYMTAMFPGWMNSSISLSGALKLFFGKGPHGCVIFTNGDSACYQFPDPRSGNSVVYIEGTAQNAQGEPIAGSGIGAGGSGGGGDPVPMGYVGDNMLGWKVNTTTWRICGYIAGKVHSCYTRTI